MTSVIEQAIAGKSDFSNGSSTSEPPSKKLRVETPAATHGSSSSGLSAPSHGSNPTKSDMSSTNNGVAAADGENIDKNLYSRQIYTLGESAMGHLRRSSVLISGLGGVGVEIAKNLILGGVRHVTLQDTKATTWSDLSAQYYLHEQNVGVNRVTACHEKLSELNDQVTVKTITSPLDEATIKEYDLVILTDTNRADQLKVSKWTRAHGRRLLVADARGLFSYIFDDFGAEFRVDDANGEQVREFLIDHIDPSTGDVVTLENLFHGLEDGDYVTFSEVKGCEGINNHEPIKITVKKPSVFNIGAAAANFSPYVEGGRVRQVKVPFTVSFKPLEEALAEPELLYWDLAKFDYPAQLHLLWTALYSFETKHGRSPAPRSPADAQLLKAELPAGSEVSDKLIELFANSATGNLVTITSVVGGIAAQEAMKAVTHHTTPIKQFLYLNHDDALPGEWSSFDNAKLTAEQCAPRQTRYDGQASVFGWPYQETLFKQRWFIVGAGAIGCELLKNLAMMGVACGEGGLLKITDMDQIEVSNLNRQFLFRKKDVGQKKSECAARAVHDFNKDIRIEALSERVGPDTETIFTDAFYDELNGVANALDNVDARRYMDRRCVYYRLPLLESGTMGTKGNTQVVYPHLTESYSSSVDPPEKEIPVCTLKNFPNEIQHTIAWAREQFETFFSQPAEIANKFLNDGREFHANLEKLAVGQRIQVLQQVNDALIEGRPSTAEDCIKWARQQFQQFYFNGIAQMLHSFPPNQLTDSGARFWSGAKRCPHTLEFDANKPEHFNFVYAASILKAEMYGIEPILDRTKVAELATAVNVEPFKPQSGVKIATTEAEEKQLQEQGLGDDDAHVEALKIKLAHLKVRDVNKLNAIDFEKDDDSNHHMEFITAASNLRAENYEIQPADRMKTKQIAGKIIPAIATTTAAIAGLVCTEFYKMIDANGLPKIPLDKFKNSFINLALNIYAASDPIAAPKKKYQGKEFTLWDRLEVVGPMTMEQFIEELKAQTGLEVSMLSAGACLLYSFFMPPAKRVTRMATEIRKVYEELLKKELHPSVRHIVLEPMMTDANDEDVEVPYIRYTL